MAARIYVIPISHPAAAGVAMLRHKRIPHRVVRLMPGVHPLLVRFAGFERHTVPALELDGRRIQGSRAIVRFLDELRPEPPLLPANPAERAAVEEAEHWGERVLQPVPRRLFARVSHADEATVRGTLLRLPGLLDRVDALIAEGTIGGEQPNAADFQILSGVRVLLEFEDLAGHADGRPCATAARRLFSDWEGPIPGDLPYDPRGA